jgi:hypothetical protein
MRPPGTPRTLAISGLSTRGHSYVALSHSFDKKEILDSSPTSPMPPPTMLVFDSRLHQSAHTESQGAEEACQIVLDQIGPAIPYLEHMDSQILDKGSALSFAMLETADSITDYQSKKGTKIVKRFGNTLLTRMENTGGPHPIIQPLDPSEWKQQTTKKISYARRSTVGTAKSPLLSGDRGEGRLKLATGGLEYWWRNADGSIVPMATAASRKIQASEALGVLSQSKIDKEKSMGGTEIRGVTRDGSWAQEGHSRKQSSREKRVTFAKPRALGFLDDLKLPENDSLVDSDSDVGLQESHGQEDGPNACMEYDPCQFLSLDGGYEFA